MQEDPTTATDSRMVTEFIELSSFLVVKFGANNMKFDIELIQEFHHQTQCEKQYNP